MKYMKRIFIYNIITLYHIIIYNIISSESRQVPSPGRGVGIAVFFCIDAILRSDTRKEDREILER